MITDTFPRRIIVPATIEGGEFVLTNGEGPLPEFKEGSLVDISVSVSAFVNQDEVARFDDEKNDSSRSYFHSSPPID